ncbi:ADP-ribosylation factor-like protein [Nannocystis sp. RBIL2]|uniref:ADP-ribosylation factor-like protein n=1 Tax=Nannocystis sp. RBIL2 TaxID=2996788 RepID=UPI002271148A|nr:ADP-ribosylation factor-like protein [Nannocystis sp. RBIL2]MCY1065732.1 ADP-ribosylation factor-like protein [Nannocystis sp. RBIL2]
MAVYERDRARIVIRVVYDGPGRAGKTTNVEQLARIFGNKPGNELQVYPAASGRTIYFDWFSFDGGMIDGHQLQVQVVTVPGHKSLEPRRAHILHTADVVVLVCDCAAAGPDAAREMLDSLREHLATSTRPVPLVVQANKQDLANAMSPQKLGAALGVGYDTPVVSAQASAGIGVRETVIGAIRAAVRQMKRRMAREGVDAILGRAGTADELRAALQDIEAVGAGRSVGERRSPEDEARGALPAALVDEGRVVYIRSQKLATQLAAGAHGEATARARAPLKTSLSDMSERPHAERPRGGAVPVSAMFIEPRPANDPPEVAAITSGAVPAGVPLPPPPTVARGTRLETPAAPDFAPGPAAEPDLPAPAIAAPNHSTGPGSPLAVLPLAAAAAGDRPEPRDRDEASQPPIIPSSDGVASPTRESLEAASAQVSSETASPDLAAPPVALPLRPGPALPPGHVWPVPGGRGVLEQIAGHPLTLATGPEGHAQSTMSFKSGGYRLHTRAEWRFAERERGREALLEHVRRTARLGPLLPAGIAVALAVGDDDAALWHIVPDLQSLGAELRDAAGAERPRHLQRLASAYAAALRLLAREDLGLELDPHAFAEQDGRWVYIGDRLREPDPAPALTRALLAPGLGADERDAWSGALEQALPLALTREDVAALGLEQALEAATGTAAERVRAALGRCP